MQLSTRPLLRVGLLVCALIAGLFAIGTASAAGQTASLQTGGDGILNADERSAVDLDFNEGSLGAASARFAVLDESGASLGGLCDGPLSAISGTEELDLSCAADDTYTIRVDWFDAGAVLLGSATTDAFDIDSVVEGAIEFDDADGLINGDGVDVSYQIAEGAEGDPVTVEVKNAAAPKAPLACKFGGLNRGVDGTDAFGDPIRDNAVFAVSAGCLSVLQEGAVVASVIGEDPAGNIGSIVSAPVTLDKTAPTPSITIDDIDGVIENADAAAGVPVSYDAGDSSVTDLTVTLADTAGNSCDLGATSHADTVTADSACLGGLVNGDVVATIAGTDPAGNAFSADSAPVELMIGLGSIGLEILDGEDDPAIGKIDNMANIVETDAGRALGVEIDLTDILKDTVDATITAVDRNGTDAVLHMPLDKADGITQTVFMDVSDFADGIVDITVDLEDEQGNASEAVSSTHLDLNAPSSTWSDAHPTCQKPDAAAPEVCEPKVKYSVGVTDSLRANFAGRVTDAEGGTGVLQVILRGLNTTNSDRLNSEHSVLENPDGMSSAWSRVAQVSAGQWEFQTLAVDLAGNVEGFDKSLKTPPNGRKYLIAGGLEG